MTDAERSKAENTANTLMPARFQPLQTTHNPSDAERLNRIECFLVEKMGFDPNDQSIQERQRRTIHAKLTERELAIQAQQAKNAAEEDAASERLTRANFGFFTVDGERLDPDSRFKDDVTGEESPTLWSLAFPPVYALSSPLALTDPKRFVSDLAERLARRGAIEWQFNRWSLERGKYDYADSNRWSEIFRFVVYLTHLPPRTKT